MAVQNFIERGEALVYLGIASNATDAQLGLVNMLIPKVERAIRAHLQSGVTQQVRTEFYPETDPLSVRDGALGAYSSYGYEAAHRALAYLGRVLQLREFPVRAVEFVDSDVGAHGGDGTDPWDSASRLTKGQDYTIDWDQTGLCMSGQLIRRNTRGWPSTPRSIRVRYTAGWSRAELQGDVTDYNLDASDITLAGMMTLQEFYNDQRQRQSGHGPLKSEKLGDWSATYDTSGSGVKISIPEEAKDLLSRFQRVTNMVL